MHVTEEMLAGLRARYGEPARLDWAGEISEHEHRLATYNPTRTHDVTLFILDPADRLALIRKPQFPDGIWRTPGGGIKPGEELAAGAVREGLEETGLLITLDRYLVDAHASFRFGSTTLAWRTHVLSARTTGGELAPHDDEEIAAARWGTLDELAGPIARRLLATGHALWRYRVALHEVAVGELLSTSSRS